ncbi:hypothetical protein [Streptomyces sp. WAC 06738]|uniref:hypothetical protein n=1 Tax=Streptomyces sp. WAC 06738 TaxID=2203210 RepID=UPI000F782361|nr:hypothetical protein [Streptomyces sp. WAC 06738]
MSIESRDEETPEKCPRCEEPKCQRYERRSLGWGGGTSPWKKVDEPRCLSCSLQELQQFEREQGGR